MTKNIQIKKLFLFVIYLTLGFLLSTIFQWHRINQPSLDIWALSFLQIIAVSLFFFIKPANKKIIVSGTFLILIFILENAVLLGGSIYLTSLLFLASIGLANSVFLDDKKNNKTSCLLGFLISPWLGFLLCYIFQVDEFQFLLFCLLFFSLIPLVHQKLRVLSFVLFFSSSYICNLNHFSGFFQWPSNAFFYQNKKSPQSYGRYNILKGREKLVWMDWHTDKMYYLNQKIHSSQYWLYFNDLVYFRIDPIKKKENKLYNFIESEDKVLIFRDLWVNEAVKISYFKPKILDLIPIHNELFSRLNYEMRGSHIDEPQNLNLLEDIKDSREKYDYIFHFSPYAFSSLLKNQSKTPFQFDLSIIKAISKKIDSGGHFLHFTTHSSKTDMSLEMFSTFYKDFLKSREAKNFSLNIFSRKRKKRPKQGVTRSVVFALTKKGVDQVNEVEIEKRLSKLLPDHNIVQSDAKKYERPESSP